MLSAGGLGRDKEEQAQSVREKMSFVFPPNTKHIAVCSRAIPRDAWHVFDLLTTK